MPKRHIAPDLRRAQPVSDCRSLWGNRETVYGRCEGFVYFIGCGRPNPAHVKIGFTAGRPYKRLRALQTGCPFDLTVIGYAFGCRAMEREFHEYLRDYHVGGEWFVNEGACAKLVLRMCAGADESWEVRK